MNLPFDVQALDFALRAGLVTPMLFVGAPVWREHAACARGLIGQHGGAGEAGHGVLQTVVRPAGIEPATPAFGGQYSIH